MIPRVQKEQLKSLISQSKLLLIQGPRRVGKETLVREVLNELNVEGCFVNAKQKEVKKEIQKGVYPWSANEQLVVIQEAQYLENLNEILEQVLMGEIQSTLIVVCSFIPNIQAELMEALKLEGLVLNMFAPSFYESAQHFGLPEEERLLEERLIFGNYPEVLSNLDNAPDKLMEIIEEAIFTTLSVHDRINKKEPMMRMLRLLAFHVGDTISYNELAEKCGLDNETVERYIKLLEDAFILLKLPSFYNGHRYELKKSHTVYFTDNGVRNALIRNFNETIIRNDMDELWRNYIISERMKWLSMQGVQVEQFFWKTHTKQMMHYIERDENQLVAYKTDWEKRKRVKFPKSFEEAYPEAKLKVINRSTYWSFLTKKK